MSGLPREPEAFGEQVLLMGVVPYHLARSQWILLGTTSPTGTLRPTSTMMRHDGFKYTGFHQVTGGDAVSQPEQGRMVYTGKLDLIEQSAYGSIVFVDINTPKLLPPSIQLINVPLNTQGYINQHHSSQPCVR